MTYSSDMRKAALAFIEEGGSQVEASRLYKVSRLSLYRWLKSPTLERKTGYTRCCKIDADKLRAHVKAHPQMYLRERAAYFGVAVNTMHYALKRLKIVKKRKAIPRKMFYEKIMVSAGSALFDQGLRLRECCLC